jgi:hypothetical protein
MEVYRLETAERSGPYQGDGAGLPAHDNHLSLSDKHPTPNDDGIPARPEGWWNYIFGFVSREQFAAWFFPDYLAELVVEAARREVQFGIARYEVDDSDVYQGGHQCAFDNNKATRLSWEPVAPWFK